MAEATPILLSTFSKFCKLSSVSSNGTLIGLLTFYPLCLSEAVPGLHPPHLILFSLICPFPALRWHTCVIVNQVWVAIWVAMWLILCGTCLSKCSACLSKCSACLSKCSACYQGVMEQGWSWMCCWGGWIVMVELWEAVTCSDAKVQPWTEVQTWTWENWTKVQSKVQIFWWTEHCVWPSIQVYYNLAEHIRTWFKLDFPMNFIHGLCQWTWGFFFEKW